ncbi:MAG: (d)CMP kinase, partial [Puniceicoccales bacterium]
MKGDFIIIAVDGGAASCKSSTSRQVAERLGLLHVDTGSHYRAVTFALLREGVPAGDESAVESRLGQIPLVTALEGRTARISLGGAIPAPEELRSEAVNTHVSQYAAIPAVRQFLFDYQRGQVDVA